MKNIGIVIVVGVVIFAVAIWDDINSGFTDAQPTVDVDLTPEWDAVAAWPGLEADAAAADPEPGRTTIVLVFDDSGSMSASINDAKEAAIAFAARLPETTHFGAVALNAGVLVNPMPVEDALPQLTASLDGLFADGGTPLTGALSLAHDMLRVEAANQRGFGTYQILVTTDGQADDSGRLVDEVVSILKTSPVTIATIGIGIGAGHPLNLGGETRYATITNVADLAAALEDVAAEQTQFDPITAFEEQN